MTTSPEKLTNSLVIRYTLSSMSLVRIVTAADRNSVGILRGRPPYDLGLQGKTTVVRVSG